MPVSLDQILKYAEGESRNRGFRSVGIYHLIWAVRKLDPETLMAWLARYQVEAEAFIKMLENLLRPRRAGGGIPRDRLDSELSDQALELARSKAGQSGEPATVAHMGEVLGQLKEDPILSLCERYSLKCQAPQ